MQKPNSSKTSHQAIASKTASPLPTQTSWKFGEWLVEPARNRISNSDEELQLEPRLMTAFELLLTANGQTVSDEQLLSTVWPNLVVSDSSLYQVITQLRKALQDQKKPYQLIERVQRKGYRLLQNAEPLQANASRQQTEMLAMVNTKRSDDIVKTRWIYTGIVLILMLLSALWLYSKQLNTISLVKSDQTSVTLASSAQLIAAKEFTDQDWIMLQQAFYLLNQPRAEAISNAVQILRKLLPAYPTYPPLLVGLCNGYHSMHIYSDWALQQVLALCEPLLQQALQQQTDFAPALGSFGALQLSRHNLAGASYYLDKAMLLQPKDPQILLWRAALYRAQGYYDDAVSLMATATELAPLSGLLKRHYAYSLLGNGELNRARAEFQHALLLEDDYSDRALDELELLPLTSQRALAFLLWAERFPDRMNSPERWTQLSLIQLGLQQMELAKASLQQTESMSDTHPFVLLAQAMLAQAENQTAEANIYLKQRVSLKPQHKIFQLQALFLSTPTATTSQQSAFYKLLPYYQQDAKLAIQQDLANNEQLNVLYFLLSLPQAQRTAYQSSISAFVSKLQTADSLSLQLLCVVGLTEQANKLALQLLDNDWLPSPHDDYYIAEDHPLWQQLSDEFFNKLQQQRQKVLSAFAAEMAERKPNEGQ